MIVLLSSVIRIRLFYVNFIAITNPDNCILFSPKTLKFLLERFIVKLWSLWSPVQMSPRSTQTQVSLTWSRPSNDNKPPPPICHIKGFLLTLIDIRQCFSQIQSKIHAADLCYAIWIWFQSTHLLVTLGLTLSVFAKNTKNCNWKYKYG